MVVKNEAIHCDDNDNYLKSRFGAWLFSEVEL